MRTSKSYVFRTCYSKGVSHYYLHLAETPRQTGKLEICVVRKRCFRYALIGGFVIQKLGVGLLEAGILCD